MTRIAVHILQAVLLALYRLFSLMPTKDRIVCISRQSDLPPTDFVLIKRYMNEQHPDWDVTILAKAMGNAAAYVPTMVRQVYHIATSRAVVLDSYCIAVSLLARHIKAPVLQMWHALGNMKKFGYTALDTQEGRSRELARLLHMHEGYDSVLVSSRSFAKDLAAGFNVPVEILYEAPLPRVDLLVSPEHRKKQRALALQLVPELGNGKKNIVYCPTFRRTPAPNEHEAMEALLDAIDFDRYNFVFKRHPVSTQVIQDERVISDYPADVDPLYVADYVISDYSTVIYEAGLLQIPLYLYAYDWDTYSHKRALNIDIEHEVPTIFTDDPERIVAAIEEGSFDYAAYRAFIEKNVALPAKGSCTQRVVEHVFSMIEKP